MRLSAEGALLTVTDVNPSKRALAADLGAQWVEPGTEHMVPADIFVPAGIGGVLDAEIIDALAASAVCGPANNPLAARDGADRLAARGILYAPDFVVNAGGVVYLDLEAKRLGTRAEIMDRVAGIGDVVRALFDDAGARGITPLEAAEQRSRSGCAKPQRPPSRTRSPRHADGPPLTERRPPPPAHPLHPAHDTPSTPSPTFSGTASHVGVR